MSSGHVDSFAIVPVTCVLSSFATVSIVILNITALKLLHIKLLRQDRIYYVRGHGGRVLTLPPPTSEAGVQFPAWPQVGKLVVACHWSAVYSTEP